jgi:tetratricopeptide (TPR) repeat protein
LAASAVFAAQAASPPLGRISFPTSGAPQAQPAFIRGVLLLHSFEYDDAIAAFREAEQIDRGFAMAYWGEALAYDQPLWDHEEVGKAREALARLAPTAAARAGRASTPREKAYLDAVERLFGDGDKRGRQLAYAERMAALSRAFPDDDEAAAFYALSLLATIPPGDRRPQISLRAGTIASAILKKNPLHPGAAHYALHAFDDGEHAALGLDAARIYAKIAPASSHARHMPAHVFLPLGMWDEAAAADESAFETSVDRVKRLRLSMAQADFHSLSWLHYEYLQQGRFARARELLKPVENAMAAEARVRGRSENLAHAGNTQHESEIGRGFGEASLKSELASLRARQVVESGAWNDMKGQGTFDNLDELFALGLSSAKIVDLARADAALEHLRTAANTIADADARSLADIMSLEIEGVLRVGRGDRAGGLAALARAVALEGARPRPVARPYPIKPAGELYGETLFTLGNPTKAATQFRAGLARTPNRAASVIGLARSASAAGRTEEARETARKFVALWHDADPARPELAEARRLLWR